MLKAFLYSWIVMLVAVFTSCEPDWDFDSDYESEVVVDGRRICKGIPFTK